MVLAASGLLLLALAPVAEGAQFLDGFSEEVVLEGLTAPTAVRFAPDGRVFVSEKSGRVLVFDDLDDDTPDVLIDLGNLVHDYWDRGLLGMAVDPLFPTQPYVYLLYTYNREATDPGSTIPRWPDTCPLPPGPTIDGCPVDGRLSRVEVALDNTLVGAEQVLIEERWCQQYPSHSVGGLEFDPTTRILYVAAGDGASFGFADYGQGGGGITDTPTPENVCDDPPSGRGGTQEPPTAEGGALRSQDLRTSGDAVTFDGALLRIDPDTGLAVPNNPLAGGDPADDPIAAFGFRSPFRIAWRPGTSEVWVGDVGWNEWEEINRVIAPSGPVVENYGWPCYEGAGVQSSYDALDLDICEDLYAETGLAQAIPPRFAYQHEEYLLPSDTEPFRCERNFASAISGLAFYEGTAYPGTYDGALFFSDYSRRCLFVMHTNAGGVPDPAQVVAFADAVDSPIDLQIGPDELLYYIDTDQGRLKRIVYQSTNLPPDAVIVATPPNGPSPLSITLDGTSSTDPDPGDQLSYAWDLDDDGFFDDHFQATWSGTVPVDGVFRVSLRVTDLVGETDEDSVEVVAGNSPPVASIVAPAPTFLWSVGETINLQGTATDPEDGTLAAAQLDWEVYLHRCPDEACITLLVESIDGTALPSVSAPDDQYPSFLEFRLTVRDLGIPTVPGEGILTDQAVLFLDPATVEITLNTSPSGLSLVLGDVTQTTPFTETVIEGSLNTITAPSPQSFLADTWDFRVWEDDATAAAFRTVKAPAVDTTYTAVFGREGCSLNDITCDGVDDDCDGQMDENYVPQATACGTGPCAAVGVTSCVAGVEIDSCDPGPPLGPDDNCDTVDDDCNGSPDDAFPAGPTTCGVGACAANAGEISCIAGTVIDTCDPLAGAAPDDATCDGVDDDCDGVEDEDFGTTPSTCGIGECVGQVGVAMCVGGVITDTCDPQGGATLDDADCNGRDDDCDGMTDEDFVEGPYFCGVGACLGNSGVKTCTPAPTVIFGANRDAEIHSVNISNQNDAFQGGLQFGTQAIEQDPATGRVYYFEGDSNANQFAYWNPTTGNNVVVRVYTPALGIFPKRLAMAPDGSMWMMDADEDLFQVDVASGDVTNMGTVTGLETGQFGGTGDFAFATDGTLWIATYRSLYTVDTNTLQATLVYSEILDVPGAGQNVFTGLAFCDGKLYASDAQETSGRSAIYEIDTDTGDITSLWLTNDFYNDLTSCRADGVRQVTFVDTCDPFDGATADDDCDGIDDDCDGVDDDDFPVTPSSCGLGACSGNVGETICDAGSIVDTCDPLAGADYDSDCDGVDDDCDGSADEHFVPGPITCGLGECAGSTGTVSCDAGVLTDTCDPLLGASALDDACNGRDDDCDGATDEDYVDGPSTCGVGACAGNTGDRTCDVAPAFVYGVNKAGEVSRIEPGLQTDATVGSALFGSLAAERDPQTGRLYYFERTFAFDELAYWDPANDQNTVVRVYDPAPVLFPQGAAIAPDGTMYMLDFFNRLLTVDLTTGDLDPVATLVGYPLGGIRGDIAFDSQGTLWAVTGRDVYTINPRTGEATLRFEGALTTPLAEWTGLAFCDGVLYGVDVQQSNGRSSIYSIDTTDGTTVELWLAGNDFNDLSSCPATGRQDVTFTDTCDPFQGAAAVDDTCDGVDDDCDGVADDDFVPTPTACGVGSCATAGQSVCVDGAIVDTCTPLQPLGFDSTCDGVDDDCDGTADEHFVAGPVTCGLGECAGQTGDQTCAAGVLQSTCDPLAGATADDATCNGRDDDCDGATDEDVVEGPNTCGLGACSSNTGTFTCDVTPDVIYAVNKAGEIQRLDVAGSQDLPAGVGLFGSLAAELDPETGRVYYLEKTNVADELAYWDPATDQNVTVRTYTSPGIFPQFAGIGPDGTFWMIDFSRELFVIDLATGDLELRGVIEGLEDGASGVRGDLTFSPDGTMWAASGRTVYTIDPWALGASRRFVDVLPGAASGWTGLGFCDGFLYGTSVSTSTGLTTVHRVDPASGALIDLWTASVELNDLTSCPASGLREVTAIDTCDPLAGAAPDDSVCNGIDDDCDGPLDEDFPVTPTACGVGACAATGDSICVDGVVTDTCQPLDPAPDDATCDDVDDDCNGVADEDFIVTPTACGVGACAATGDSVCIGGIVTDTCMPSSPAPDDATCNGIDDDCDGPVDEDAPALGPAGNLYLTASALIWESVDQAQTYQVIRGDLPGLRAAGGDFVSTPLECLADAEPSTSLQLNDDPGPGQGWWYLYRAVNCVGRSTYNSTGGNQLADRDGQVAVKPEACP